MITFYSKSDLVSFGRYLLSKKRTERISVNHDQNDPTSLEERLSEIYDADLANWQFVVNKFPETINE